MDSFNLKSCAVFKTIFLKTNKTNSIYIVGGEMEFEKMVNRLKTNKYTDLKSEYLYL